MTALATNSFADVNAVIEEDEIRQVVDACPLNCLVVFETGPLWLQHGRFGPDLSVARHAGFGRRNPCERGLLHAGVAIATIYTHTGDVMFVAKRDGLIDGNVYLADVVDAVDVEQNP